MRGLLSPETERRGSFPLFRTLVCRGFETFYPQSGGVFTVAHHRNSLNSNPSARPSAPAPAPEVLASASAILALAVARRVRTGMLGAPSSRASLPAPRAPRPARRVPLAAPFPCPLRRSAARRRLSGRRPPPLPLVRPAPPGRATRSPWRGTPRFSPPLLLVGCERARVLLRSPARAPCSTAGFLLRGH